MRRGDWFLQFRDTNVREIWSRSQVRPSAGFCTARSWAEFRQRFVCHVSHYGDLEGRERSRRVLHATKRVSTELALLYSWLILGGWSIELSVFYERGLTPLIGRI